MLQQEIHFTHSHTNSHTVLSQYKEREGMRTWRKEKKRSTQSWMQDIFSNMERLNNVLKQESVELDLKS